MEFDQFLRDYMTGEVEELLLPSPPAATASSSTSTAMTSTAFPPAQTIVYPPKARTIPREQSATMRQADAADGSIDYWAMERTDLRRLLFRQSALAREYLQLHQQLEERRRLAVAERLQHERTAGHPRPKKGRPIPAALRLVTPDQGLGPEPARAQTASTSRSTLPSPGCHLLYPGTGLTPVLTSPPSGRLY